jgi:hypothetical protein
MGVMVYFRWQKLIPVTETEIDVAIVMRNVGMAVTTVISRLKRMVPRRDMLGEASVAN